MDEMLVELFVHHPAVGGFDGNLLDMFFAVITGVEYRLDNMPGLIGLYGGWYTIVFHPGEP